MTGCTIANMEYMEARIRFETAGEHGIDALKG